MKRLPEADRSFLTHRSPSPEADSVGGDDEELLLANQLINGDITSDDINSGQIAVPSLYKKGLSPDPTGNRSSTSPGLTGTSRSSPDDWAHDPQDAYESKAEENQCSSSAASDLVDDEALDSDDEHADAHDEDAQQVPRREHQTAPASFKPAVRVSAQQKVDEGDVAAGFRDPASMRSPSIQVENNAGEIAASEIDGVDDADQNGGIIDDTFELDFASDEDDKCADGMIAEFQTFLLASQARTETLMKSAGTGPPHGPLLSYDSARDRLKETKAGHNRVEIQLEKQEATLDSLGQKLDTLDRILAALDEAEKAEKATGEVARDIQPPRQKPPSGQKKRPSAAPGGGGTGGSAPTKRISKHPKPGR